MSKRQNRGLRTQILMKSETCHDQYETLPSPFDRCRTIYRNRLDGGLWGAGAGSGHQNDDNRTDDNESIFADDAASPGFIFDDHDDDTSKHALMLRFELALSSKFSSQFTRDCNPRCRGQRQDMKQHRRCRAPIADFHRSGRHSDNGGYHAVRPNRSRPRQPSEICF
jgi:hypothetical protein